MKLKTYNSASFSGRRGVVKLSLGKSGLISISLSAASMIGVKSGDRVELVQDEDAPRDWYIKSGHSEHGYLLRGYKNGTLCFGSKPLAQTIADSLGRELSLSIPVATEKQKIDGQEYYALITAALK